MGRRDLSDIADGIGSMTRAALEQDEMRLFARARLSLPLAAAPDSAIAGRGADG